jgi:nicotinate-nucleotide adenylyltransferase
MNQNFTHHPDNIPQKHIALFGTSADPPTLAHQTILQWLAAHYDWVAVWASDNPFKHHQTSLEHRMKMLRLMIEELNIPQENISLYEELSERRSLMSVEIARAIWGKKVKFTLVIGSDLVKQIPSWYRIEQLLQKVQLLIIPRPHYTIADADLEALNNLEGNYQIADLNVPAISSTAYRENRDNNVLSPAIQDYIYQTQLYK